MCSLVFGSWRSLEIIAPATGYADSVYSRFYWAYFGIEYKVPIIAKGGLYQFKYSLLSNPAGAAIDSTSGVVTWTPSDSSGNPYHISVQVADSGDVNKDTVSWTISVTKRTIKFIFVATTGSNSNSGTITSPKLNLSGTTGHPKKFVYLRNGTYDLTGLTLGLTGQQQERVAWSPGAYPCNFLEYPGETVVIDHDIVTNGAYFNISSYAGTSDQFYHGIKFQDMLNHAMRNYGNRIGYFECEFINGGPGVDGENSSYIMWATTASSEQHSDCWVKLCKTGEGTTWCHYKVYATNDIVFDSDTLESTSVVAEGLALKGGPVLGPATVQGCVFDNLEKSALGGNWNPLDSCEIRYNLFLNNDNTYSGAGDNGDLEANHDNNSTNIQIYRNTFTGNVVFRYTGAATGPFTLRDNVIVNNNAGYTGKPHVDISNVTDASLVVMSDNLTGYPSDNIVDANGDLTEAYNEYLYDKGYQWQPAGSTGPIEPPGTGGKKVLNIISITE